MPGVLMSDDVQGTRSADAFVAFGVSGDLARKMTFVSLYQLERRGLLDCPIIGVAAQDWTDEDLRRRAAESVTAALGDEQVDAVALERLRQRMSYVGGDFADAATFAGLAKALGGAARPVFYLEIPPSLFGTVVEGLAAAGLTTHARVVVEKPFGHDLQSAQELNARLRSHPRGVPALSDRSFPGEAVCAGHSASAVREHRSGAAVEPELCQQRADHDGGKLRRRG